MLTGPLEAETVKFKGRHTDSAGLGGNTLFSRISPTEYVRSQDSFLLHLFTPILPGKHHLSAPVLGEHVIRQK